MAFQHYHGSCHDDTNSHAPFNSHMRGLARFDSAIAEFTGFVLTCVSSTNVGRQQKTEDKALINTIFYQAKLVV